MQLRSHLQIIDLYPEKSLTMLGTLCPTPCLGHCCPILLTYLPRQRMPMIAIETRDSRDIDCQNSCRYRMPLWKLLRGPVGLDGQTQSCMVKVHPMMLKSRWARAHASRFAVGRSGGYVKRSDARAVETREGGAKRQTCPNTTTCVKPPQRGNSAAHETSVFQPRG